MKIGSFITSNNNQPTASQKGEEFIPAFSNIILISGK